MSASVTRLPGDDCQHHLQGRCLYEENLNPGYHDQWRCLVLKKWAQRYDDFLQRAEAFRLEMQDVTSIWHGRMERLLIEAMACENYASGRVDSATGCAHNNDDMCLLLVPECSGRCRHFVPKNEMRA